MRKLSSVVRSGAAALLIFGSTASVPAEAQIPPGMTIPGMPDIPGMFTSIALTDELVVQFITAYPTVSPALETLGERYDVPEGDDPAAMMAALAMLGGVNADLNAIVTPFGFTDFQQYSQVMLSILGAYAFADPDLTAEQRTMMAQFMPPFMMPTDENVAIVAAHYAELKVAVDAD